MFYEGLVYGTSKVNDEFTSSAHLNISSQYRVNRVHFRSFVVKPGCFVWVKTDL